MAQVLDFQRARAAQADRDLTRQIQQIRIESAKRSRKGKKLAQAYAVRVAARGAL